jgi:hypothetical protein
MSPYIPKEYDMTHAIPDANERPTVPLWPDAGQALGVCRSTAYNSARAGDIPTIKVGSRLLVPTAALRRMLQLDDPASIDATSEAPVALTARITTTAGAR